MCSCNIQSRRIDLCNVCFQKHTFSVLWRGTEITQINSTRNSCLTDALHNQEATSQIIDSCIITLSSIAFMSCVCAQCEPQDQFVSSTVIQSKVMYFNYSRLSHRIRHFQAGSSIFRHLQAFSGRVKQFQGKNQSHVSPLQA